VLSEWMYNTMSRLRRSKTLFDGVSSPDGVPSSALPAVTVSPDPAVSSSRVNKRVKVTHDSPMRPDNASSSSAIASKCIIFSSSPSKARPTPEECAYVVMELGKLHPKVLEDTKEQKKYMGSCGMKKDILDGVVSTMLSQNTTSANSTRAFASLKKAFPTWETVVQLKEPSKLEDAIRCGGLAKIKAGRIMTICQTLQNERGLPSLEYLRNMSNEEIQKELMRFPGLGKKTVSCVLLFTLGREEFPVDTHVHRISKQLKWIPAGSSRDDAYEYLNAVVPGALKRDLHCLLIQHGRECHRCAARGRPQFPPKDGSKLKCPLVDLPSFKDIGMVEVKIEKC
jgi:endonuclease III